MEKKTDFLYELVTNKIIALLEKGTVPWKKAWKAEDHPINLITKIPYKGINVWMLNCSPNAISPYWLTWAQVMKLGGEVKANENKKYEYVVFYTPLTYEVENEDGESEIKSYPFIKYARVYNLSQCVLPQEKMDKLVPKVEEKEFNPIETCEKIVSNYKDAPPVNFGGGKAFYAPMFDKVQMPLQETFDNEALYYSTLFHEFGHSTGAPKRLNRFKASDTNIFGAETYSKEELVAEMTASFLCAKSGIDNETIENSAAYIKGWLEILKDDKGFVISASSKGQFAADYILQNTEAQREATK
jgi:antirestriction protein ArdC